ncbi:unnamed protein product [Rhizopus stolonifer]
MIKDLFQYQNGIKHNAYRLPATEQEDEATHRELAQDIGSGKGLNTLLDRNEFYKELLPNTPAEEQPRIWRDTLAVEHMQTYGFTSKQCKYQEILYEVILTEQSYLDDLILIHEIFIKEAIRWDGLLYPVEKLFKCIKNIIEFHFLLLVDLRKQQQDTHPVVTSITDIFINNLHRFKVYFSYFRDFEKANTLIQKSIKSQDVLGSIFSVVHHGMMKYPLFFKSLGECLSPYDSEIPRIQHFMEEIEKLNLSCRIKGLEGSTVHIAESKRKLIYEGYLAIIPQSNSPSSFSRMSSSTISFASTADTPRLRRRNSTFNLSSKKQDRAYVFLFNDLIVCTRERSKKKPTVLDERGFDTACKQGSYFGPSPNALFEIIHAPGKITMVDRHVARETMAPPTGKLPRKGSGFLQSFKRYGSRVTDDESNNMNNPDESLMSYPSQQSLSSIKQEDVIEEHPLQFVCSVATKNLTNIRFEAETVEEKEVWCNHFDRVLKYHVQRDYESSPPESPGSSTYFNDGSSSCADTGFSIVSASSKEITMEIDPELTQQHDMFYKQSQNEALPTLINRMTIFNDNNNFYNTLLDEFGDKSWIRE